MQGNDHSVVRAVLAGDKEAYGTLVRAHSAAVFRVAFRIAGNEADAEEIVQESFLRAYQRPEKCAVVLRHLEERSMGEIAEGLGVAPNAAKQAVFRAVQKLRRELAPLRGNV